MQLASLSIRNFRGIREADLALNEHNVFIGANNSGKTTVIEALALLFGRDRMVRSLTEHDFYGSDPGPADRIRLTAITRPTRHRGRSSSRRRQIDFDM